MKSRAFHRSLPGFVGFVLVALLCLAFRSGGDEEELTPQELVRRHLASIASPEKLKQRQVFAVQGNCEYRILAGGALAAPGKAQLVSHRKAYNIRFDFTSGEYGGTQYITDGKKSTTKYNSGGQVNPMRIFLQGQGILLTEGLLGGELTTAWALLDVKGRKPSLKYRGIQGVDGRQLYRLDYRMRKGAADLKTRLYFDPETYHHVLTTYEVEESSQMGATPDQSSQNRVSRQRVEESFSDFRDLGGYMLPSTWVLKYFKNTDQGTILLQWTTTIEHTAENGAIPPNVLQSLMKMK
ncbi:MAG: hypothetical protein P8Z74_05805 [Acidobacteriota bacterium]